MGSESGHHIGQARGTLAPSHCTEEEQGGGQLETWSLLLLLLLLLCVYVMVRGIVSKAQTYNP